MTTHQPGTHDSHGPHDAHGPHGPHGPAMPPELTAILADIVPPGGHFGHREHIHLAYVAVRRYGATRAPGVMAAWIRHLAAYQRAPQKFHATVTRAWVELVAHHMAGAPAGPDFATFAASYPPLFDKRLLTRHYSSRALASPTAKAGWLEPDLVAFPWRQGATPK